MDAPVEFKETIFTGVSYEMFVTDDLYRLEANKGITSVQLSKFNGNPLIC